MIDITAAEPHFADHLAPIASELAARGRHGTTYTDLDTHPLPGPTLPRDALGAGSGLVVVASWRDCRAGLRAGRRVVLCEHGAGQSYTNAGAGGRHRSYVGGAGRDGVELVLVPNEAAAERHRECYGDSPPVRVVGSPRVDALRAAAGPGGRRWGRRKPTVAVAWHWSLKAASPEAVGAFGARTADRRPFGREVVDRLARLRDLGVIRLLGHAHPRVWGTAHQIAATYERHGIEAVRDFDEVVARADVLVVDNSSILFEWCALDRPVVVVNSPAWRRTAAHGLRFWTWADVGPQIDRDPDATWEAVLSALEDRAPFPARRAECAAAVFPHAGEAARLAVDAILDVADA